MATKWPEKRDIIGTRVKRLDGPDKATGRAKYSYDVNRPGQCHAIMLRSPHAHCKITKLDLSKAKQMPGVRAIQLIETFTDGDVVQVAGNNVTLEFRKGGQKVQRKFAVKEGVEVYKDGRPTTVANLKVKDPVRIFVEQDAVGRELFFVGDEILAIAATTEEQAKDALRAVKIEYEVLKHVVKEEDAFKADPESVPPIGTDRHCVRRPSKANKGEAEDLDKAFKTSDAVVEETYSAPVICHQCLESHGLVAEWNGDLTELTTWASTQAVYRTAQALAGEFKMPQGKVKCITHYMGGGFGSKFGPDVQGITAAYLALKAKAPVKLMLTREAEVTTGGNRPSVTGKVKIAGDKSGKITAYSIEAYGSPGVQRSMRLTVPYVYDVDLVSSSQTVVRLNAGGQRAMRAPGHPQSCYVTDSAVTDLAAKLGLDPMKVCLKNLPKNDPGAITDAPTSWNAIRETVYKKELEIAAKLSGWNEKWHPPGADKGVLKSGLGLAIHTWGGSASGQPNDVTLLIASDGSVTTSTSSQDLGTAQRTVNAIVAAEILGLKPTDITVTLGESPMGRSSGSGGSTTCPSQAPATLRAATAALDDFLTRIAPKLGSKKEDLTVKDGKVIDGKAIKTWSWKQACAKLGMEQAKGVGTWTRLMSNEEGNENVSNVSVGGVQIAEVVVDTESGVVYCKKVVAVQDCGMVINKLGCETQVSGGVIMALNAALFEERIMDRNTGRQMNADMEFYKMGGLRDMPEIVVHMHDMPERGVIGIGEPPTISTMTAIGNAVQNAIGVRVPTAPFTPERVLAALAKKGGKG